MENIGQSIPKSLERLRERAKTNKGFEYKRLYVRLGYEIVRDGYIRLIGPNAFTVFFVIRTYMNKNKIAYPSLNTIAYQSGLSVKTVGNAIKILIDNGWIKKEGRIVDKGKFGNTKYLIAERRLIRGTDDPSFIEEPIVKTTNGEAGYPLAKNQLWKTTK